MIEADESDGSIVQYHPEIGLLLNVDKDHKEIDVLMDVFTTFKNNSKMFIVNQSHLSGQATFAKCNGRIFLRIENSECGLYGFRISYRKA